MSNSNIEHEMDSPVHQLHNSTPTQFCHSDPTGFEYDYSREHVPSPELLSRSSTPETPLEHVRAVVSPIGGVKEGPSFETLNSLHRPEARGGRNGPVSSFASLRITYLFVTFVIMLADGLQGTHLYVLYESYGFTVAYLYCLGFATGALLSPMTGPLVDKIGRKRAAILYCVLEIFINSLEQYPSFTGVIASRMIGGFTTNLLCCVFEAWLDTEYRRRGLAQGDYEIIMRDSVIVRDLAAIFSGYMAHLLADRHGAVGPFEGAVSCTAVALMVVLLFWTENYGSKDGDNAKDMSFFLSEAVTAFRNDSKTLRLGIVQALSAASVQIFVFLWAPALRQFAHAASKGTRGLDQEGEPAYGIIFGTFMAAGVLGGLVAPLLRVACSFLFRKHRPNHGHLRAEEEPRGPVEFVATSCYFLSAVLLFVPAYAKEGSEFAFSQCLAALIGYEVMIGVFLPLEGVMRSTYFPETGRASMMTLPSVIVNIAVALGVFSTNFIRLETAFFAVASLMLVCAIIQASLIIRVKDEAQAVKVDATPDAIAHDMRPMKLSFFAPIQGDDDDERFMPSLRRTSACTEVSDVFHCKLE